jgi:hypothetical protein
MKKLLFYSMMIFMLALAVLVLRPIIPSEGDSIRVEGFVSSVFEGGVKDACFRLKGDNANYYINRGLENGLFLDSLKQRLLNQRISIFYADHWTPLDPEHRSRHITRLEYGSEVLYSEF